jgi:phage terminase large subunit-like protein
MTLKGPKSDFHLSSIVKLKPSKNEIDEIISNLSDLEAEIAFHDWRGNARPEQVAPEGDWAQWLFLAGRGAGKTRAGAEWVREMVMAGYTRGAMIAPTASDARDVMVEGTSGLLATGWSEDKDIYGKAVGVPVYEPTKRRVRWANGAMVTTFSAEEPDRLRGPQHEFLWCDELAAWKTAIEAWDMLSPPA